LFITEKAAQRLIRTKRPHMSNRHSDVLLPHFTFHLGPGRADERVAICRSKLLMDALIEREQGNCGKPRRFWSQSLREGTAFPLNSVIMKSTVVLRGYTDELKAGWHGSCLPSAPVRPARRSTRTHRPDSGGDGRAGRRGATARRTAVCVVTRHPCRAELQRGEPTSLFWRATAFGARIRIWRPDWALRSINDRDSETINKHDHAQLVAPRHPPAGRPHRILPAQRRSDPELHTGGSGSPCKTLGRCRGADVCPRRSNGHALQPDSP